MKPEALESRHLPKWPGQALAHLPSNAIELSAGPRGWEKVADDLCEFGHRLINAHDRSDELAASLGIALARYVALEQRWQDDLARLAAVERARRALEAAGQCRSEQVLKHRANEQALIAERAERRRREDELDSALARLADLQALHASLSQLSEDRATLIETLRAHLVRVDLRAAEQINALHVRIAELDALTEAHSPVEPLVAEGTPAVTSAERPHPVPPPPEIERTRLSAGARGGELASLIKDGFGQLSTWLWAHLTLRAARHAARAQAWPVAERLYDTLLLARQSARLWKQFGHTCKEQGRTADALDAYQQAVAMDPNDSEARDLVASMKLLSRSDDKPGAAAPEAA